MDASFMSSLTRGLGRQDHVSFFVVRFFAELLIDCEEDWTLRAVLVGILREAER